MFVIMASTKITLPVILLAHITFVCILSSHMSTLREQCEGLSVVLWIRGMLMLRHRRQKGKSQLPHRGFTRSNP